MLQLRPLLFATALALPLLAAAQTPAPETEQPEQDPPGRVARLSYVSGDVTFQSGAGDAIEAAALNLPVTTGDRLMTGAAARSEITFGIAAVRLDSHTDLSIANLDDELAQLAVNSGTIAVHVRELQDGQTVQIDTPNATVQLLEPGDYRVEVDSRGDVYVDVRSGEAEIDSGRRREQIQAGEQARLAAGDDRPDIRDLGREDDFDRWAQDREQQLNGRETTRYVSREVVGHEDLDGYGDWRVEAGYGAVWYPRVAVGWAPYRYGRWVWVAPWGWTWIDRSPWGFAPFHYGRWAYVRSSWCWIPGPRHYRPVYAPALVGWVGDPYRGSISLSINTSPIGWFPLGPREVYVPHRHVSPRYLRSVNVSNTVIVNNTYITNVARNRVNNIRYVNRDVPNGITRAPQNDFDSRRPSPDRQWTVRRGADERNRPPGFYRDSRRDDDRRVNVTRDNDRGATVRQTDTRRPDDRPAGRNDRNRNDGRRDSERNARPAQAAPPTTLGPPRSSGRDRDGSSRSNPGAVQRPVDRPRPPPQFERDFNRSRDNQGRDDSARRERQPRETPGVRSETPARRDNHLYRVPDRSNPQPPRVERREERREQPARSREQPSRPPQEQRPERRHNGAIQGQPPRGNQEGRGEGSRQRNERPR